MSPAHTRTHVQEKYIKLVSMIHSNGFTSLCIAVHCFHTADLSAATLLPAQSFNVALPPITARHIQSFVLTMFI